VLFVCEDNRISATTPTGPMTAGPGTAERARSLDIAAETVDGNDVVAVDAAAGRLVEQVRAGGGPRLLHAITYRLKGHVSIDPGAYRDPAEVARALASEPLRLARDRLLAHGVEGEVIEAIEREARAEVAAAQAAAEASPWPTEDEAFRDVTTVAEGVWQ
jgi:pyruvate dehydrogenase E1 component alpha subunit